MKTKLLQILQHSLGVDEYGNGNQYRNYFGTTAGCDDYALCEKLCENGLMQNNGKNKPVFGDEEFFSVTRKGKEFVAKKSPKTPPAPILTRSQKRYQEYLECEDCYGSFAEFLRIYKKKEPQ